MSATTSSNGVGVSGIYYIDRALFTNLEMDSDAVALNYIFDSKLDFNGAYRIRLSDTDNSKDTDQSVTLGADGSLLPEAFRLGQRGLTSGATATMTGGQRRTTTTSPPAPR